MSFGGPSAWHASSDESLWKCLKAMDGRNSPASNSSSFCLSLRPGRRSFHCQLSRVQPLSGPGQREYRRGLGLSSHISRAREVFLQTMQPEKEEEFKKFGGRREPGHSGLRIAPKRASAR